MRFKLLILFLIMNYFLIDRKFLQFSEIQYHDF